MSFTIEHRPAFAWLRVKLTSGQSVRAEAGAMVMRSPHVEMTTRLNAGLHPGIFRLLWAFFVALLRKLFGGETMFVNDFQTHGEQGEVVLAPSLAGDIVHQRLVAGQRLFVQAGSYLASTGNIDTKLRFGGLRTLFGGEGLVLLDCVGEGDLFINSYGGITPIEVKGSLTVDTGHIVAFDGSLDFKLGVVGGMKSLFLSGEGLVCRFFGQGTVYIQSRNVGSLASWISPMLPG
jgi:uncharacterized protein (TIGR00266 family)